MYLKTDDRERGSDNFCAAIGSSVVRRKFFADASLKKLTPADGLGGYYFHYDKPEKPLVVGVIGAGKQGQRLILAMNPAYLKLKSIADIRPSSSETTFAALALGRVAAAIKPLDSAQKEALPDADARASLLAALTARQSALAANAETKSIGDALGKSIGEFKKAADQFDAAVGEVKKEIQAYDDYQKLIDAAKADGVEAVIIALPSHLHAPATQAALKAKLHVLVETPMALTVADAKAMTLAARENKLCLAVAQQRRYSVLYDNALEVIRTKLLSEVHYLRAQWHVPFAESEGKKSAKKPAGKEPAINWWRDVPAADEKLAASQHGYGTVKELLRWQLWQKYSGGLLMLLGEQMFDAALALMGEVPNRGAGKMRPLAVSGASSQVVADRNDPTNTGDIDDHVHCLFEFPTKDFVDVPPRKVQKKISLQYDLIIGNEFDMYGETMLGTQGTLVLEAEKRGMLFKTDSTDKLLRVLAKKDEASIPKLDIPKDASRGGDPESEAYGHLAMHGVDNGTSAMLEHWAVCCASPEKNKPRCDAETGLAATVLAVAAVKAVEQGIRVDFQDAWFDPEKKETPDDVKAG